MELLLLWLLFAIFSAAIASAKNRSGFAWFILGALFGPFGLLVAFFPKLELPHQIVRETQEHKKCPFCAEEILLEAIVCKHCGRDVPPVTSSSESNESIDEAPVIADEDSAIGIKKLNPPSIVAVLGLLGAIVLGIPLMIAYPYWAQNLVGNAWLVPSETTTAGSDAKSIRSTAMTSQSDENFGPITREQPKWTEWEIGNALFRSGAWLAIKQGPDDCYLSQSYESDPNLTNLRLKGNDRRLFVNSAWQGTRRVTYWIDSSKKTSFTRKSGGNLIHLPEALIPSLKAGRALYINLFVNEQRQITQEFDLSGFSAAYTALDSSDCRSKPTPSRSVVQPSSTEASSVADKEPLIPRSPPGAYKSKDTNKYYLLSAQQTGGYLESLHKRVGPSSTAYLKTRIDCNKRRYQNLAYSDSGPTELLNYEVTPWIGLKPGTSQSDLVDFVCVE